MAHQNASALQLQIQLFAADALGLGEDEVGEGGKHLKAQVTERLGGVRPILHDGAAVIHVVIVVAEGGMARGGGHAVDVVGVGGVAHRVQVCDEGGVSDAEAQSCACQGAGLREGLGDKKIIVLGHQLDRTLRAEVHVGLVDHHHAVGVGLDDGFDLVEGQAESRGGVGVGDDDGLAAEIEVVPMIHREVLFERDFLVGNAVQLGEDGVEAVGDGGEDQGVILVGKGHEGEVQHLVGAVGEDDLLGCNPVEGGQLVGQLSAGGVGVELEPSRLGLGCLNHGGGGREGRLVGVELDILHIPRLLAGGVGGQLFQPFGEEAAHIRPPRRGPQSGRWRFWRGRTAPLVRQSRPPCRLPWRGRRGCSR